MIEKYILVMRDVRCVCTCPRHVRGQVVPDMIDTKSGDVVSADSCQISTSEGVGA